MVEGVIVVLTGDRARAEEAVGRGDSVVLCVPAGAVGGTAITSEGPGRLAYFCVDDDNVDVARLADDMARELFGRQ